MLFFFVAHSRAFCTLVLSFVLQFKEVLKINFGGRSIVLLCTMHLVSSLGYKVHAISIIYSWYMYIHCSSI